MGAIILLVSALFIWNAPIMDQVKEAIGRWLDAMRRLMDHHRMSSVKMIQCLWELSITGDSVITWCRIIRLLISVVRLAEELEIIMRPKQCLPNAAESKRIRLDKYLEELYFLFLQRPKICKMFIFF